MNAREQLAGLVERLEAGGWDMRAPQELADIIASELRNILAALPEPGVVTDEAMGVAWDAGAVASGCAGQEMLPEDAVGMRAALKAALPYLTPAAPEFTEKHGLDLRGIKVGEILTDDQWQAVCAFVQEQDAIIDAYEERAMAAPAGEVVDSHFGYVVDGAHFYYADFPRSEWPRHKSVVPVYTQPAPAAQGFDAEVVCLSGWKAESVEGADIYVLTTPTGLEWIVEPHEERLHVLAAALAAAAKGVGRGE